MIREIVRYPIRVTKSSVVKTILSFVFLVPGALVLLMGLMMAFIPGSGPEEGIGAAYGIMFALLGLIGCGIGGIFLAFSSNSRCGSCDAKIKRKAKACPSCGVTFAQ